LTSLLRASQNRGVGARVSAICTDDGRTRDDQPRRERLGRLDKLQYQVWDLLSNEQGGSLNVELVRSILTHDSSMDPSLCVTASLHEGVLAR